MFCVDSVYEVYNIICTSETYNWMLAPLKAYFCAEYGLVKQRPIIFVQTTETSTQQTIENHGPIIAVLSSSDSVQISSPKEIDQKTGATSVINESATVLMELDQTLLDKEKKRLQDKQVKRLIPMYRACHLLFRLYKEHF